MGSMTRRVFAAQHGTKQKRVWRKPKCGAIVASSADLGIVEAKRPENHGDKEANAYYIRYHEPATLLQRQQPVSNALVVQANHFAQPNVLSRKPRCRSESFLAMASTTMKIAKPAATTRVIKAIVKNANAAVQKLCVL